MDVYLFLFILDEWLCCVIYLSFTVNVDLNICPCLQCVTESKLQGTTQNLIKLSSFRTKFRIMSKKLLIQVQFRTF